MNCYRILFCSLSFIISLSALAQTATLYRSGSKVAVYSSLSGASAAANMDGDSIVLSADIFNEHDVPVARGQIWQGTYTATDSTLIDAKRLGRVLRFTGGGAGQALTIRDIIMTNGYTNLDGGGIEVGGDTLKLRGRAIIRNCRADRKGGGLFATGFNAFILDNVQITNNSAENGGGCVNAEIGDYAIISGNRAVSAGGASQGHFSGHAQLINNIADSFGGGGVNLLIRDSVIISDNRAAYGGGVYTLFVRSGGQGVRLCNNIATIAGGAIFGGLENYYKHSMVITGNEAPLGTALYDFDARTATLPYLGNCYIYNPGKGLVRQNEIYFRRNNVGIDGAWFGQSDTTGLIIQIPYPGIKITGNYAIANWSLNRGLPLGPADTVFPVGAAFTYSDGSPLPPNSCSWLQGHFSASRGFFPVPAPMMSSMDTLGSLFHTYFYTPGMSGSNPVSFVCYADRDTFRVTALVWGKDPGTGIFDAAPANNVLVYPNPARDMLHLSGAESGDQLFFYDLSGKTVLSRIVSTPLEQINVGQLSRGQYLIKVVDRHGNTGKGRLVLQ